MRCEIEIGRVGVLLEAAFLLPCFANPRDRHGQQVRRARENLKCRQEEEYVLILIIQARQRAGSTRIIGKISTEMLKKARYLTCLSLWEELQKHVHFWTLAML